MPCHTSDLWSASTQSTAAGCAGAVLSHREHGCCFPKVNHHRPFHTFYISKRLIFGLLGSFWSFFLFLNNHKCQHLLPGREPFGSVLSQGRERGCQRLLQVLFLVRQLFTSSIPTGNSGSKSDADAFLSKYRKGGEPPLAVWLQLPAPTGMWPQGGGCGPAVPTPRWGHPGSPSTTF